MATIYQPLPTQSSIRLLLLRPGWVTDIIRADLVVVDLADKPKYECLSYRWSGNPELVYINGCPLEIPGTLGVFLRRLRVDDGGTRTIWADAICINQQDDDDKGKQVFLMGSIYRLAAGVLAWVGAHADGSEQLFRGWPNADAKSELRRRKLGLMLSSKEQQYRKQVWQAFLAREYFTRTWIVQEIALAQEVYVHCGEDVSSWEDLINSRVEAPLTNSLTSSSAQLGMSGVPRWDIDGVAFREEYSEQLHLVRNLRGGGPWRARGDLLTLARQYGTVTNCGMWRDKIFAFLGMATVPGDPRIMEADYNATAAEIFLQAWLGQAATRTRSLHHPGPFVTMLGFTYQDDCQFADFLLDDPHTGGGEDQLSLLNDGDPARVAAPSRRVARAYLDAFQAIWDSKGTQGMPRLGDYLPSKTKWHTVPLKGNWRYEVSARDEDMENFTRWQSDFRLLSQARDNLRAQGWWPQTRLLRDLVARQIDERFDFMYLSSRLDPHDLSTSLPSSVQVNGTEPMTIEDAGSLGGRKSYKTKGLFGSSKTHHGVFVRPSAVDNSALQREFKHAQMQQTAHAGQRGNTMQPFWR